jgi:pimeloyl-ACP methyl ester carboxylesterase
VISNSFKVKSDINLNITHFTPQADQSQPVIIFIHPTGFVSNMFATVVAHLRGFNCFGLDLRSHGASDRGNVTDWAFLGNDLVSVFNALKKRTGHEKFYGVGISSGSSTLALHASKHSEDFHALYLCEPIVFPPDADLATREFLANSAKNRRDTFESKEIVFERFSSRGALASLDQSSLALYAEYGFKEISEGVTLCCNKEDEEAIYLSGSENNVYEILSEIKVKTHIIYGEISNTISNDFAKEIAGRIQDSSVEELAGVGHFTLFENPTLGAESITRFIRDNS